jgi:hypothetical protein
MVSDVQLVPGFGQGPHVRVGAGADVRRARRIRQPGRDLGRPVEAVALDDPVPGQHLLGFGVRPVGDHRSAASCSLMRRACAGAVRPRVSTSSPDLARSSLNDSMNSPMAAKSAGAQPGSPPPGFPAIAS